MIRTEVSLEMFTSRIWAFFLRKVLREPVFNICKTGLYFVQLCCIVIIKLEIDLGAISIKMETDGNILTGIIRAQEVILEALRRRNATWMV